MKVIQTGNQPWSRECVCENCKAKLLVEYGDLFRRLNDYSETSYSTINFKCPECLNETELKSYDGPYERSIPFVTYKIIKTQSIFSIIADFLTPPKSD